MNLINQLVTSRWDLAFIRENMDEIVNGNRLHFVPVKNPFRSQYMMFADPFVLDVTDSCIFLLVETMRVGKPKGCIAKLTIDKTTMSIIDVCVILEEPWHLSFPNIMRKDDRIFVYPESASSGHLYLYELVKDGQGKECLKQVDTLCDDIIWDTDINNLFGRSMLFTARQNNHFLDIYQLNDSEERYEYVTSLHSSRENMRLAGALFPLKDKIYIPTQVSGYRYGEAVEIQEISNNNPWFINPIRHIKPPRWMYVDGMHTLNSYKGVTVVDLHVQNNLLSWLISKLVILKKKVRKFIKSKK